MIKILLDENLPKPLVKHFSARFEATHVHDLGWTSKKNGELIDAMVKEGIAYLLTADRNLEYQQNLDNYPINLVVLITHDNRYKTLASKVAFIEKEIEIAAEKKLIHLDLR